jgi:DNA-binding PadR family transcriptional regulator
MSISKPDITADDVLRRMLLGFMRLHVLYHVDRQPTCGTELMEELRSHGYDVGPGTLYPMLRELLEAGHVTCEELIVRGKRRKNYRATASGRRLLSAAREKLLELTGELVHDRDAMQARRSRRRSETVVARRGAKRRTE